MGFSQKSFKTRSKNAQQIFKHLSENAFFKNANFVARLLFETIFERASQKEKKIATFEKWKLSDWPKNPKSICSWTFGVWIIHPEHPSTSQWPFEPMANGPDEPMGPMGPIGPMGL